MLEILAIWLMGKKAGEIAEDKGYSGVLFTLLFISLWVICEIGGFIIGLNMAGDRNILAAYALALMGALIVPHIFAANLGGPGRLGSPWRCPRQREWIP